MTRWKADPTLPSFLTLSLKSSWCDVQSIFSVLFALSVPPDWDIFLVDKSDKSRDSTRKWKPALVDIFFDNQIIAERRWVYQCI